MQASKVYFTNMRIVGDENICQKLVRLCKAAGIEKIDFKDKFTAIKLHFGEAGNLAFLRPDYARAIVDLVRSLGGRPYVTDCSTLYVGQRSNALDHLDVAYRHGYNPISLGCHTIIADGLKGTDDVEVPIHCEYVEKAKIGRAVMDADVFISLSHFKGHEGTGFGGALKNIGMGCGSKRGKAEMRRSASAAACALKTALMTPFMWTRAAPLSIMTTARAAAAASAYVRQEPCVPARKTAAKSSPERSRSIPMPYARTVHASTSRC